jgi:hypothetical protein
MRHPASFFHALFSRPSLQCDDSIRLFLLSIFLIFFSSFSLDIRLAGVAEDEDLPPLANSEEDSDESPRNVRYS